MEPSQDPLYEMGSRMAQQNIDRSMQRLHNAAQFEQQVHQRLSHFATVGITQKLWIHSRTAVFLYIVPFWLFLASLVAFALALASNKPGESSMANIAYGIGTALLLGMWGCMIHGARRAIGLNKFLSVLQIIVTIPWAVCLIHMVFNPHYSLVDRYPAFVGCLLFAMLGFFGLTVLTDLVNGFRNRTPSME